MSLRPSIRISTPKLSALPRRKRVNPVSAKQKEVNAMIQEKTRERWNSGPRLCMLTDPPHRVTRFEDFVLDHATPGKMGRNTKDHSDANLQDACRFHNRLKGSQRNWKKVKP